MSRLITPFPVRLAYPSLFTAQVGPSGGKAKYGAALVFDKEHLPFFKQAAIKTAVEKWGPEQAGQYITSGAVALEGSGSASPSIRTDGEAKGFTSPTFIQARTTRPPSIVTEYADPTHPGKPARFGGSPSDIYSGMQVKVAVSPYAMDVRDKNTGSILKRGVWWSLDAVQVLAEQDEVRWDGSVDAQDVFSASAGPAPDLSDLAESQEDGGDTASSDGSVEDVISALMGN